MNRGFLIVVLLVSSNAPTTFGQILRGGEVPLELTVWTASPEEQVRSFLSPFAGDLSPWTAVDIASSRNWYAIKTTEDGSFATCNGYRAEAGEASDDWLISPRILIAEGQQATFRFETKKEFKGPDIQIWILEDPGESVIDPSSHTIEEITPLFTLAAEGDWTASGIATLPLDSAASPNRFRIGIRYVSEGALSGEAARWGFRNPTVVVEPAPPPVVDPVENTAEPSAGVEAAATAPDTPLDSVSTPEEALSPEPKPLPFLKTGPRGK